MYDKYLFSLNEMYYGKHPLLIMIEKYFNELKNLIIEEEIKYQEEVSRQAEEAMARIIRRRRISESSEITSDNTYKDLHKFMKNIVRTSNIARVALHDPVKIPQPTEEELRQAGYKNTVSTLLRYFSSTGYFEPKYINVKYYINLIKNICEAWMSLFKFNGVTLDIIVSSLKNAFYFPGFTVFDGIKELNFTNEKPIEIRKWVNRNRTRAFESNNQSIYFKKYDKHPVHIFVTTDLIKTIPSNQIVAILLHEIGHSFGYRMLPVEYLSNAYIQEKFADAFATKFGYGVELIRGLKNISNSLSSIYLMVAYNKTQGGTFIGMPKFSTDKNINSYLKLKVMMHYLLTRYDIKSGSEGGYYDPHPVNSLRYKEQLKHLIVELDNPRLNNLQKRQLENDIKRMKQELSIKDTSIIGQFSDELNREGEKSPITAVDEYKAKLHLNQKIIRDLLDKIYDDTQK